MLEIEIPRMIFDFSIRPQGHNIKLKLLENNLSLHSRFSICSFQDPKDVVYTRRMFVWGGEYGLKKYLTNPDTQALYTYVEKKPVARIYFTNPDA